MFRTVRLLVGCHWIHFHLPLLEGTGRLNGSRSSTATGAGGGAPSGGNAPQQLAQRWTASGCKAGATTGTQSSTTRLNPMEIPGAHNLSIQTCTT